MKLTALVFDRANVSKPCNSITTLEQPLEKYIDGVTVKDTSTTCPAIDIVSKKIPRVYMKIVVVARPREHKKLLEYLTVSCRGNPEISQSAFFKATRAVHLVTLTRTKADWLATLDIHPYAS